MAKIAALIMPVDRADTIQRHCDSLKQVACLHHSHRADISVYQGNRTTCALMRIAPDTLNPTPQPISDSAGAGVACGYYLSADKNGDSATRLLADVAGEDFTPLTRNDGVYAFARWQAQTERLVCGVDKLGMRPLFWCPLPSGGYAVASEIKLLIALQTKLEINWAAWEEYMAFGFLFGEHTFHHAITRFGPAEVATFDRHSRKSRTIESFLETIDVHDRSMDAFLAEQEGVFDAAMRRLTTLYDAPGQTMLTLTGGCDSRRALGWLLNQNIYPTAYTVPEVLIDGREFESAIVREIAQAADLQAYKLYPPENEQTQVTRARDLLADFESDEHNFATILALCVDRHDRVNFDGLGAGSQLSGSFVTDAYFQPGGRERFLSQLYRSSWFELSTPDAPPLHQRLRAVFDQWGDDPNAFAYFYLMSRTRREIALAPLSIQANVFESLCPYLDREMMRSALSFPPQKKINADVQAMLFKRFDGTIASIPTNHDDGVDGDSRYLSWEYRRGERQLQKHGLRNTARAMRRPAQWSLTSKQKWRYRAANLLHTRYPADKLNWELIKANRINQLLNFEEFVKTPAAYNDAVRHLRGVFGNKRHWKNQL